MAAVESFALHARNLMDFFAPDENYERHAGKKLDVFAVDYCSSWQSDADFTAERSAISREILHLSYLRPGTGREWPYVAIRGRIESDMLAWLDTQDRLHVHISNTLRGICNGQRVATTYIPEIDDPEFMKIEPAMLSGVTRGVSTPTSAVVR
jgi:hypothetical protein